MIRVLIEDYYRAGASRRTATNGLHAAHRPRPSCGRRPATSDFYRENMYAPMDIEAQDYYAKPMNCPFHI